jgi:PhnB protein
MGPRDDVATIPDGYGTVTPWILSKDTAGLIEFTSKAFDAVEIARVESDGAIGHAEVRIGESVVMMFDVPDDWPETPAFLRVYVDDGDAVFRKALAAGASVVTEMTVLFWGDRVGRVRDPLGNIWWIQQRVEDLDPEEMARRESLPEFSTAMEYVQRSLRLR